jgi:formyltetrahydrofolate deformylase
VTVSSRIDSSRRAVLLASCPDQRGLVAHLAQYIYENNGNILDSDQHTDREAGLFATRLEWELDGFRIPEDQMQSHFGALAKRFQLSWSLHFLPHSARLAVFVSKQDHCLLDLLARQRSQELGGEIVLIVSNHEELASIAQQFSIPFHYVPKQPSTKLQQEQWELELLASHRIDLLVLAKYMQVLSSEFLAKAPQTINIHHSFLPAFPGASPYHKAFARGVKIIGATAHYVTEALDEGPIIEQDVSRVSHRDSVQDMIRKGKDLEKAALARAVYLHLQRRVLVYHNKTIVFD